MGTKKLDTETRQRQIVNELLRIVANDGLEGLSVAELANRIDLVPSGIYRHFEGKDQIILAALEFVRDHLFQYLQAVKRESADPVERLHSLFTYHLGLLRDNPGIPGIVLSGAVFSHTPPNRDKAKEIVQGYLMGIAEIIRAGQQEGHLRSDRDPMSLSVMFLGLILPMVLLSKLDREKFDCAALAEKTWTIFSETIVAPTGPAN